MRNALIVAAAWTLVGLLQASLVKATVTGDGPGWSTLLIRYVGLASMWALLTPGIVWWTRRLHPARIGWPRTIAAHAPAWLLVAVLDAAVRRALIVATGGTLAVSFAITATYFADVVLVLYVVVAGLAHAAAARRTLHERTLATVALEAEITRARLAQLESQLQPHFLFNTLTAITELAHESPSMAAAMLARVRALLSGTVRQPVAHTIRLEEELALLEPYVELQSMRFGDRLSVSTHVAQAARAALVPAMVLQPLVENAIKHGLADRARPGRVLIEARVDGTRLRLAVRDDGAGVGQRRPAGDAKPSPGGGLGIGLRNIADRLQHLYGSDHRFELVSPSTGGTAALIELPLRLATVGGNGA